MDKYLIKHKNGVVIREDIFQKLEDYYEAFKVLLILANRAHARIVNEISYWEVVVNPDDLKNLADLKENSVMDCIEALRSYGFVRFCAIQDSIVLIVMRCMGG